ncbi:hypothetical protein TNCV_2900601 [Trichonephila clavipes]|nr:hypothetical protein TNCV_2900601 [Trichonephila clavipes]
MDHKRNGLPTREDQGVRRTTIHDDHAIIKMPRLTKQVTTIGSTPPPCFRHQGSPDLLAMRACPGRVWKGHQLSRNSVELTDYFEKRMAWFRMRSWMTSLIPPCRLV